MAQEASKAMRRRWCEDYSGGFPWRTVFKGKGIDVGCGPNKIPFDECIPFDLENGDANDLTKYFATNTFNYVHSSQSLEHMIDPHFALMSWLTVTKPHGHVIVTVPDIGVYERFAYPSRFNPDHRSSWSLIYQGSCFPIHCHIPSFLNTFSDIAEICLMRFVEKNYDWNLKPEVDQTWEEISSVEIWNEFVLRKKTPSVAVNATR